MSFSIATLKHNRIPKMLVTIGVLCGMKGRVTRPTWTEMAVLSDSLAYLTSTHFAKNNSLHHGLSQGLTVNLSLDGKDTRAWIASLRPQVQAGWLKYSEKVIVDNHQGSCGCYPRIFEAGVHLPCCNCACCIRVSKNQTVCKLELQVL